MSYIFQLSYMSQSREPFSQEQLDEMLVKARENNDRLGVTGVLIYNKGVFLQLLEGSEEAVQEIFQKICLDPRHHHIQNFFENYTKQRMFENWSMAYQNIDTFQPTTIKSLQQIVQQFHNVDIVATRDEWRQVLQAVRSEI